MAIAIPIIAIAFSAFSAYTQYESARKARSAAEDRAQMLREETAEEGRRMSEQHRRDRALAKARAGASGVAFTGTVTDYLSAIETEQRKELDWLWRSGESQAQQAVREGELAFMSGAAGALGTASQAGGQLYSLGSRQGWWTPGKAA